MADGSELEERSASNRLNRPVTLISTVGAFWLIGSLGLTKRGVNPNTHSHSGIVAGWRVKIQPMRERLGLRFGHSYTYIVTTGFALFILARAAENWIYIVIFYRWTVILLRDQFKFQRQMTNVRIYFKFLVESISNSLWSPILIVRHERSLDWDHRQSHVVKKDTSSCSRLKFDNYQCECQRP